MTTTVLNNVVPLNRLSRSLIPMTIVMPCLAAASCTGCKSPLVRSTAFSRNRAWISPVRAPSPSGPEAPNPSRISWDIGFGKNQERRAFANRFVNRSQHCINRTASI